MALVWRITHNLSNLPNSSVLIMVLNYVWMFYDQR